MQPLIDWVLEPSPVGLPESPRLGGCPVSAVTCGKETFFEESRNMDESGNNGMEDFMSHRELEGRRNGI